MLESRKGSLEAVADESVPLAFVKIFGNSALRYRALRCVACIIRYFFLQQYRAALLPGRIPVTAVDHPLDKKIPFVPIQIETYIDFVSLWIRMLSFALKKLGRSALEPVGNFLESMGDLYIHAAGVYGAHLSTTKRPFYLGRPRFIPIRVLDPHLMCVPSLHVMVVIRTYTWWRDLIGTLGAAGTYGAQAEELRQDALAITEAVLYVKQHSVNCIPAAMYAMSRFEPRLFPPEEAEAFCSDLFTNTECPRGEDSEEIRRHILGLYRRFIQEGPSSDDWRAPLLRFLEEEATKPPL